MCIYLSSKGFRHTSSPCTGIEAFRPQRLRYVVNMDHPTTFGVDTENICCLAEFFRLEYDGLKNLRTKSLRCVQLWEEGREPSTFALPSTSTIAK